PDGRGLGVRGAIVVPIVSDGHAFATLIVGTTDAERAPFAADEVGALETLAGTAGIALALGEARADKERLAVLAEQVRIAQEVGERLMAGLFTVGLRLQGVV